MLPLCYLAQTPIVAILISRRLMRRVRLLESTDVMIVTFVATKIIMIKNFHVIGEKQKELFSRTIIL